MAKFKAFVADLIWFQLNYMSAKQNTECNHQRSHPVKCMPRQEFVPHGPSVLEILEANFDSAIKDERVMTSGHCLRPHRYHISLNPGKSTQRKSKRKTNVR